MGIFGWHLMPEPQQRLDVVWVWMQTECFGGGTLNKRIGIAQPAQSELVLLLCPLRSFGQDPLGVGAHQAMGMFGSLLQEWEGQSV